ncbi:MAG: glycosyltransferase family 39 protein, partial [Candidatus Auribacterota bacterium]|nr:glycosyltransferase family 39 protein [Candidatus Auribacterota bacterium]
MKKWVFIIFAVNLVVRLLLINWHPAIYTDSVLYMGALDRVRGTIILPAYPYAIVLLRNIFSNPVISGRLVSIIAAALAIFPLYGLTRIIYEKRAALFTILLYSVSPLIFRWSLRIFPHSLYALFVLLFLYGIFKYMEKDQVLYLAVGIFAGGLAVLTYPTGLVLAPVAVVALAGYLAGMEYREKRIKFTFLVFLVGSIVLSIACFIASPFQGMIRSSLAQVLSFFPVQVSPDSLLWQLSFIVAIWLFLSLLLGFFLPGPERKSGWWYKRPLAFLVLIISFSSFVFLHIWQHYLACSTWYQKGMMTSYRSLTGRWESWLTHYLYSYPYVLFYPVALAALLGL